jgi:hypothetical protein
MKALAPGEKRNYLATMIPRAPRSPSGKPHQGAMEYEIAQERAAALGRLGRALEVALAALARHDSAAGEPRQARAPSGTVERARLVQEASYALWCFIIQRETCGLRDERQVVRAYNVPGEVRNRMGAFGAGRAAST